MKIFLICCSFLLSMYTQAEEIHKKCVTVKNLKGWAVKERNSYAMEEDGFSINTFYLNFGDPNKKDSWMTNEKHGERIFCLNLGILVCIANQGSTQVMTWSLDDKTSKVIHTRHIGGDVFGGAMMMIGDIDGECD